MVNQEKEIIVKATNEIRKIKGVKAIMLFGSYASGRQRTPLSDIDICVFIDGGTARERADIVSRSSPKMDISIFDELPLAVRHRVLKEGKLLYCSDKLFFHRIKVTTIYEYIDFKPALDRMVARVLENV